MRTVRRTHAWAKKQERIARALRSVAAQGDECLVLEVQAHMTALTTLSPLGLNGEP